MSYHTAVEKPLMISNSSTTKEFSRGQFFIPSQTIFTTFLTIFDHF